MVVSDKVWKISVGINTLANGNESPCSVRFYSESWNLKGEGFFFWLYKNTHTEKLVQYVTKFCYNLRSAQPALFTFQVWIFTTPKTSMSFIKGKNWEKSYCPGKEGTSDLLYRVLHTFHELVLPKKKISTTSSLWFCSFYEKEETQKNVFQGKEVESARSLILWCILLWGWGIKMSGGLTLCHPSETPPAHPFAQPARTPSPDRFHCVRAEVHNHQAAKHEQKMGCNT